jgi:hypothetical protein
MICGSGRKCTFEVQVLTVKISMASLKRTYPRKPGVIKDSLNKNPAMSQRVWDVIISNVLSIAITIVFGYYFLYVGDKEREPTFYIDPIRTVIIDKTNAADAPLQLLKPNLDTIDSDVVSVYFYFFNQGKETIKRENVYAPITIKVKDAEILYYKVLKTARPISGIKVSKDTVNNQLMVDFDALEKDDGFVGQIIFEGDRQSELIIDGGVDRVKFFKSELVSIPPVYFLIALFIFLIAAFIFLLLVNKRNTKSVPKFLFFFSALPVIYLLLMFYKTEWFVDHKVPETLRIEHYVQHSTKQVFELRSWFH